MVSRRTLLAYIAALFAVCVAQVAAQSQAPVIESVNSPQASEDTLSNEPSLSSALASASVSPSPISFIASNNTTSTGAPASLNTSAGSVSSRLSAAKFIAGLFWSSQTTGMHRRCSATVISENLLVTSAACAQSQNPISKFGNGEWRIVAGTDDRFLDVPAASAVGNKVASINMSTCANFAAILLSEPLTLGKSIKPILLSNSPAFQTTTVVTYNTTDPAVDPLVILTPGTDEACELLFPGYSKKGFLCTLPVDKQTVTADYLGGDPIIGFVPQDGVAEPVLFGVTGLYYSTIAEAQAAQANDPTAYRYSPLVAQQVGKLASLGGLDAQKIATPATPI
ncbi:hypothetical protein LPJ64_000707 [Coemansia asiatica]|uniref:Peptidase S1 domain-containing protein n=1 Tax=Coemansia asiatica TaxID=1052880 RepID=A0A9W7XQE4_9FUNG|nr:hypothetical protein LPJ64_000707 [Coemansia asiatica]